MVGVSLPARGAPQTEPSHSATQAPWPPTLKKPTKSTGYKVIETFPMAPICTVDTARDAKRKHRTSRSAEHVCHGHSIQTNNKMDPQQGRGRPGADRLRVCSLAPLGEEHTVCCVPLTGGPWQSSMVLVSLPMPPLQHAPATLLAAL